MSVVQRGLGPKTNRIGRFVNAHWLRGLGANLAVGTTQRPATRIRLGANPRSQAEVETDVLPTRTRHIVGPDSR